MVKFLYAFLIFCIVLPVVSMGQVTVSPGATAAALANKLLGGGITIISPTLTCPGNANGIFTGVSSLGFDSGIVLTNGQAMTVGSVYGAFGSSSHFASTANGTPGDAQLTALAGVATYDACVLQFDLKPAGDTIKFQYVFGSEEYSCCVCSPYNDVFGFFISGPGYSTSTNIATVPGTTIPVCINSVNCSSGALCSALGTGSPFCAYYVNNSTGSSVTYVGLTKTLTAAASVTPCDTYHLKIAIADGSDDVYDSGVFLEAGSLSSTGILLIPSGLNPSDTGYGSQFCIRGCTPGKFIFSRPIASSAPLILHFYVEGTAVNGHDYSMIADSVTIPAYAYTDTLLINPLPVTAAGPKTVKLLISDSVAFSCGAVLGILDSAQLTINDSITAIGGANYLCMGGTITLTDVYSSGTWSSGNPGIATIGSATGIVTGVSAGIVTMTFTVSGSCSTTKQITVNPLPGPIAGPATASVCVAATILLTDTSSGGTWTSSSTGIATVAAATGTVTGAATGATTIVYTLPTGCAASMAITVNPLPHAISGTGSECVGATITLTDITPGGTWSSGIGATVGTTGIVTGVSAGTVMVTYTSATGCKVSAPVTVNPLPAPITGAVILCTGTTTAFADITTGGFWSSSNSTIAGIGSGTGIATGVAAGIVTISYTLPTGCAIGSVLTVDLSPPAISGISTFCTGQTTTLVDGGVGTWSSSNTAIATVGSGSGLVSGITSGTATITFTLLPTGGSCTTTFPVTLVSSPAPITGATHVCPGVPVTLSDSSAGGIWTSSASYAPITPGSGVLTATGPGVATISYTLGLGCSSTITVTVYALPGLITGGSNVCVGSTLALTDAGGGGTWSSNNMPVATAGTSGIVSGITPGIAVIFYTNTSGCYMTDTVTVNPLPPAITGASNVCVGLTATVSDPISGGTWSSSATATATIGSSLGIMSGVGAGIAIITYTFPTGCFITTPVTVNSSPGAISGVLHVCVGMTTALGDPVSGGVWSSGSPAVATIGTGTGIVSGSTSGTTVITYSLGAGCNATATVTVNPLPGAISGTLALCPGAVTTLTASGGGTWASGNTAVATIGSSSGVVSAITSGVATITYTLGTGCTRTVVVTVNPLPDAITGTGIVCTGSTITLSDGSPGGTWSTPSTTATVGSATGVVTGVSPGTAFIYYSISGGCPVAKIITVNPSPLPISGLEYVCAGSVISITDGTSGGAWSTASTVITIGTSSGIVTGYSAGTALVSYTLPAGCYATELITINPLPAPIGGPSAVCTGSTITLTDGGLGAWSSSSPSVATIGSATGVVNGLLTGSTIIHYTLPTGCSISKTVTVSTSPSAIAGLSTVCSGATITMTDLVSGGEWSSSNTAIATVGSLSGIVAGVAMGSATISYSLGSGCTVIKAITVNASPDTIAGTANLCTGTTTALGDGTGGGVWSSSPMLVATVGSTGIVSGLSPGTAIVSYTEGGCAATLLVTVDATPSAIGGPATVCTGSSITATDLVTGGTWSTASTAITIVGGTGHITGIATGTAAITYAVGSCIATRTISINPSPVITGATGICTGTASELMSSIPGGAWSSGSTTVATVGSSTGLVAGVGTGITTINYALPTGCISTAVVTVNSAPPAISGAMHVCAGTTMTLSDGGGGGSWSITPGITATIGTATGVVSGLLPGIDTVTYSLGSGCTASTTITVNAMPAAITGTTLLCMGSTTTLGDATPGGAWSSGNTAIATAAGGGIITGVDTGIATISYTTGAAGSFAGCTATIGVTVHTAAASISGASSLCAGLSTTLSDLATGGVWSILPAGVATIGSATGTVIGTEAGVATVTYTLPSGCTAHSTITIEHSPAPITGITAVCVGATTTLADVTTGGTWSSASGMVSVGTGGGVTGISTGTALVSYIAAGCPAVTTVTVSLLPGPISGAGNVCNGATATLTDAGSGDWSSSNTLVATVGTGSGIVTGVSPGTATITYSLGVGCSVTTLVTVQVSPPAIAGPSHVCLGATVALTDPMSGGTWSSGSGAIATVGTSGSVAGVTAGTAIISYSVPSISCPALLSMSVIAVLPVTGVHNMCAWGDTMTVSDATPGGVFTSSAVTVTNLGGGNGRVTADGPGTGTVTYILLSVGCSASATFTVNSLPGEIDGTLHLCTGATSTLADGTIGGVWSASGTGTITVGTSTGIVTGVSAGIAYVTYTLPATGCKVDTSITVIPIPTAGAIDGPGTICAGATITLADSAGGGVWSSSGGTATVVLAGSLSGTVTGVSAGIDTIKYTVTNSCGTAQAIQVVTINTMPVAGTITGTDSMCAGNAAPVFETVAGGIWSCTNANATIAATSLVSAMVTGVSAGMDTVVYTVGETGLPTECIAFAEFQVKVIAAMDCGSLEVGNKPSEDVFNVWPNPANNNIRVRSGNAGALAVIDVQGQKVASYPIKAGDNYLELSALLSEGVYLLEFTNDNGTRNVLKLVITK